MSDLLKQAQSLWFSQQKDLLIRLCQNYQHHDLLDIIQSANMQQIERIIIYLLCKDDTLRLQMRDKLQHDLKHNTQQLQHILQEAKKLSTKIDEYNSEKSNIQDLQNIEKMMQR
jgi:hypothetical protein